MLINGKERHPLNGHCSDAAAGNIDLGNLRQRSPEPPHRGPAAYRLARATICRIVAPALSAVLLFCRLVLGADHALAKTGSERIEMVRVAINALTQPLTVPPPAQAVSDLQDDRDQASPVVVPVRVLKPSGCRLKFPIVTHDVPRSGPNPSSPPKRSEVSLSLSSDTCMSARFLCLELANYEIHPTGWF